MLLHRPVVSCRYSITVLVSDGLVSSCTAARKACSSSRRGGHLAQPPSSAGLAAAVARLLKTACYCIGPRACEAAASWFARLTVRCRAAPRLGKRASAQPAWRPSSDLRRGPDTSNQQLLRADHGTWGLFSRYMLLQRRSSPFDGPASSCTAAWHVGQRAARSPRGGHLPTSAVDRRR